MVYPIPIQKPKMVILTIVDIANHSIKMDDGFSYFHSDFQGYPVGTKFAVLKEMSTAICSGMIVQVLPIEPQVIAASACSG